MSGSLNKTDALNFCQAFAAMKDGKAVSRAQWSGSLRIRANCLFSAIDYKGTTGISIYWIPKQEDLFATDWGVVDG
jgi:hypothetical protein